VSIAFVYYQNNLMASFQNATISSAFCRVTGAKLPQVAGDAINDTARLMRTHRVTLSVDFRGRAPGLTPYTKITDRPLERESHEFGAGRRASQQCFERQSKCRLASDSRPSSGARGGAGEAARREARATQTRGACYPYPGRKWATSSTSTSFASAKPSSRKSVRQRRIVVCTGEPKPSEKTNSRKRRSTKA
jgi:hypothetical protein